MEGRDMYKLLLSVMRALALAVGSAATAAASPNSYPDTVVGIETALPQGNTSTFAGFAFGQLPGPWTASVSYTSVPGAIIGGSFALKTSRFGVVKGSFDSNGGTITVFGPSSGSGVCTQTYEGVDTLSLSGPTTGSGSFHAILTHYGFVVDGHCQVFFATVSGTVILSF